MNSTYWTESRVAGGFLASSFLLLVTALIIMLVSGAAAGFRPMIGGALAEVAPYADMFRLLILLFIISWIVHLVGLGLFSRLLAHAGQGQLVAVAFILILVTVVTAIFSYSFRMTFELWAAREMARTGSLPALYEPLRAWSGSAFRIGYRLHLIAMIVIGWAILRSGILTAPLAWAAIVWSALWLMAAFLGAGAPAIPLLMPAVIGIALMAR